MLWELHGLCKVIKEHLSFECLHSQNYGNSLFPCFGNGMDSQDGWERYSHPFSMNWENIFSNFLKNSQPGDEYGNLYIPRHWGLQEFSLTLNL